MRGVIVVVFFVVYQQLENHVLQPVIYGRTVQLSPLTVLVAVLIGAELAGVLGALAAIPIAGSLDGRRPRASDLPARDDDRDPAGNGARDPGARRELAVARVERAIDS